MRFSMKPHPCYGGIDLHARTMYVCILSQDGVGRLHRHMPANPDALRKAIAPSRDGIVIAVACLLTWYGLADLWAQEELPFVLATRCRGTPSMGTRRKTRRSTPRRARGCWGAAWGPRPMSLLRRCGRPVLACGGACLSRANAPRCSPISSIPTARITCQRSAQRWRIQPIARESPSGVLSPLCRKASQALWPCLTTRVGG
jgi:hypothetical protein